MNPVRQTHHDDQHGHDDAGQPMPLELQKIQQANGPKDADGRCHGHNGHRRPATKQKNGQDYDQDVTDDLKFELVFIERLFTGRKQRDIAR